MNENALSKANILREIGRCLAFTEDGRHDFVGASFYFHRASALGDGKASFG
jgi:hypothetical protein